jgi:ABC-type phosphate transport system substrate-binding protein
MTRYPIVRCSFLFLLLWANATSPSSASDDAFKVIVHRDNPITVIDRDFLRATFLKTAIRWGHDGNTIHPIELPKGQPARDRFTREVLGKTPAQLRIYWIQRIFSGTAVPPPYAETTAAAIAYVLTTPGALAYVPANADPGGAKVIEVE